MTDLERMYASLGREVDTVMLNTPEAVRRRADRRSRIGAAAAAVAVAALVGGVAVGGHWILTAGGESVQPDTGTSSSPSTSPSTSPSASVAPTAGTSAPPTVANVPKVIPASAFLQPADTNGDEPAVERPSDNMLPDLCGATYPSDSLIQARKTMHITYWAAPSPPGTVPDGTFDETITTYKQDGADQFTRQLRDAVTACPTEQRNGITYRNRIVPGTTRGDESILIEQRYPTRDGRGNPTGGDDVRLVSVVRTGAVVLVLYEQGWEDGWSAEQPVVDAITGKAFTRLRTWLD
jgi:hypothetical protein